MSEDLGAMRKDYERGALDEGDAGNEPLALFRRWFDDALADRAQIHEPNAMTLATVDDQGRPSTRIVLVKDVDGRGVVWYTNYHSRKGRELAINPNAALQFHWVAHERVVRIEGRVERVDAIESDTYYASRPLASRSGAWASNQSEPISSRAVLAARVAEFGLKYGLHPPRPPHWGGYRLAPQRWEFWQGRKSRLHDRIAFERGHDGGWTKSRLSP
ncbi:MAG: pyridoxamine 5'-phosphate oxidase [Burkholderiaceae bacterium]